MPTLRRLALPLAFAVAAGACSTPKADTLASDSPAAATPAATAPAASAEEARQAIDAANAKFVEAIKRGDTAVVASLYADDGISMPPNEPARRGRAAVAKALAADFAKWTMTDETLRTEDVLLGGDLAVETGTFDARLQMKGGGPVRDQGKYITVWKRQPDGTWKIVRDIFNSDAPPPK